MKNFPKEVGDVLRSFKLDAKNFDGAEILNDVVGQRITTRLKVAQGCWRKSSMARPDERFGAEVNRLVKKICTKF